MLKINFRDPETNEFYPVTLIKRMSYNMEENDTFEFSPMSPLLRN